MFEHLCKTVLNCLHKDSVISWVSSPIVLGIIDGTRLLLPSFPGESLCQQGQEGDRIVRGQEAEISRDIYTQGDTHCSAGHRESKSPVTHPLGDQPLPAANTLPGP